MLHQVQTNDNSVAAVMDEIGRRAKAASGPLATAGAAAKNAALEAMADAVMADRAAILAANTIDVANAEKNGLTTSFIDRLKLTDERISAIAEGIRAIAMLADPFGHGICLIEFVGRGYDEIATEKPRGSGARA